MTPPRVLFMVLGLSIFVVGAYLVFFEAGLERWISIGLLTAGIVILIGLLLMGFASEARSDEPATREIHHRDVVQHREVVREHEPVQEHVVHHHKD